GCVDHSGGRMNQVQRSNFSNGSMRSRFWWVALFCVVLVALPAHSQLPTGTILGVVKDSSGAAVPGATITVTETETNATHTSMTASDGDYRFPALQPGHYSVKVEKDGFKTNIQTGLTLDVTQEISVNVSLEVGSSSQQVTVTGEAPLVNTQTS